jgi:hypothetical protein
MESHIDSNFNLIHIKLAFFLMLEKKNLPNYLANGK